MILFIMIFFKIIYSTQLYLSITKIIIKFPSLLIKLWSLKKTSLHNKKLDLSCTKTFSYSKTVNCSKTFFFHRRGRTIKKTGIENNLCKGILKIFASMNLIITTYEYEKMCKISLFWQIKVLFILQSLTFEHFASFYMYVEVQLKGFFITIYLFEFITIF